MQNNVLIRIGSLDVEAGVLVFSTYSFNGTRSVWLLVYSSLLALQSKLYQGFREGRNCMCIVTCLRRCLHYTMDLTCSTASNKFYCSVHGIAQTFL